MERLLELIKTYNFWYYIGQSLTKIVIGYLVDVVVATILALVAVKIKLIHEFLYPVFSVIKATPVASFIIFAIIWVKSQNLSTFCVFLMVVPMIYSSVYQGLKNVDSKLIEVGESFALSRRKMITSIYIPSVLPYFISSCTVALGFAWKSGIAAEVIGLPNKTIGIQLYNAKVTLETVDLFAWTITIVILSVIMEKLIMVLVKRFNSKQNLRSEERRVGKECRL